MHCSRPVNYAWDRVDPNVKGTCIDVTNFFVASGSINVVLNFVVFVLVSEPNYEPLSPKPTDHWIKQPLPLLWRLRTTVRQQIILTAIFMLAGL